MNSIFKRGYKLPFFIAVIVALVVTFNPFKSEQNPQVALSDQNPTANLLIESKGVEVNEQTQTKRLKIRVTAPEKAEVIAIAKHYQEAFRANPRSISRLIKIRPAIESHHVGFVIEPGKEKGHFEQLGLQLGDIITAVNGVEVSNLAAMQNMISGLGTASTLELSLVRNEAPVALRYEIN